jgi:hypothetical protein
MYERTYGGAIRRRYVYGAGQPAPAEAGEPLVWYEGSDCPFFKADQCPLFPKWESDVRAVPARS